MGIRHYELVFTAEGPVHIGCGSTLSKKGYFVTGGKGAEIAVLDERKFVGQLNDDQLEKYMDFLEKDSRSGLQDLLGREPEISGIAQKSIAYRLVTPLSTNRGGLRKHLEVKQFVKDAYNCPYVPGSSVKGMLRTAILVHAILADPKRFAELADGLEDGKWDDRSNRNGELKQLSRGVQRLAFCPDDPKETGLGAARDILKYISVSDSDPLDTGSLALAKKHDKFSEADGGEHKMDMGKISDAHYYDGNELDIYRESLRPGTSFSVRVDIDERIDKFIPGGPLDAERLLAVLRETYELYKRDFLDYFPATEGETAGKGAGDGLCQYIIASGPREGSRCPNAAVGGTGYCRLHQDSAKSEPASSGAPCYLGGGTDYDIKTVTNALLDGRPGRVFVLSRILYGQFPTRINRRSHPELWAVVESSGYTPREMHVSYKKDGRVRKAKDDHRHWQDEELGVSPHTLKYGMVGKEELLMGRCSVVVKELK